MIKKLETSNGGCCVSWIVSESDTQDTFSGTEWPTKLKLSTTRHEGAWGERRYSSYSFLTSALDGGEWSASAPTGL
jgi:hypothetical protein